MLLHYKLMRDDNRHQQLINLHYQQQDHFLSGSQERIQKWVQNGSLFASFQTNLKTNSL